jgi:hypothetical protein
MGSDSSKRKRETEYVCEKDERKGRGECVELELIVKIDKGQEIRNNAPGWERIGKREESNEMKAGKIKTVYVQGKD